MEIFNFGVYLVAGLLLLSLGLLVYVRKQVYRIKREKRELFAFSLRKHHVLGELVETSNGTRLIIDANDNAVSNFIKIEGVWENHVSRAIDHTVKEGDVVVVLGGHIGYHVLELSKLVGPKGHVYVFEASPHNFYYLSLNLKINDVSNVTCYQKAVYSRTDILNFAEQSSYNENSGMSRVISGQPNSTQKNIIQVEAVVLDDFLSSLDKIDVLQMDIEGSEVPAVAGAKNLIARSPSLTVIQEYSLNMMRSHGDVNEYVKFWGDLGFSFAKILPDGIEEVTSTKLLSEEDCDILISRDLKGIKTKYN